MITMSSMLSSSRGWRRAIIVTALAFLLGGCSALRLVYTQAGELGYWWFDGYVDFDETQTPMAREAIDQWFAWHRRSQLPDYADLLRGAANDAAQDISAAQACAWFDRIRTRADTAVEKALPEAAALVMAFKPEQLRALQRKQAKNNADFRDDFLQTDLPKRLAKSVERAVDRSEQLYGSLDESQRKRIEQRVATSPFDPERWNEERQRRQRELLQVLTRAQQRPPPARDVVVADLRTYWKHTLRSSDEGYARYQQALEAYNCEFFAEIHNRTTPEQRQEAQRRLRGWETDFRRLASS
jgi:hypothetical protein